MKVRSMIITKTRNKAINIVSEVIIIMSSMVSIPELDVPAYKPDDNWIKASIIIRTLIREGYDVDGAKGAVKIIESNYAYKSRFDYPYGSFNRFKRHVNRGDFDVNIESLLMTEHRRNILDKSVKEHKLWVTC